MRKYYLTFTSFIFLVKSLAGQYSNVIEITDIRNDTGLIMLQLLYDAGTVMGQKLSGNGYSK